MGDNIAKGDLVRLKSGGPTMTVAEVGEGWGGGEVRVWCDWFDDKKTPQSKDFPLTSVEKIS